MIQLEKYSSYHIRCPYISDGQIALYWVLVYSVLHFVFCATALYIPRLTMINDKLGTQHKCDINFKQNVNLLAQRRSHPDMRRFCAGPAL